MNKSSIAIVALPSLADLQTMRDITRIAEYNQESYTPS